MIGRVLPPVVSPLSFRALLAGARACLTGGRHAIDALNDRLCHDLQADQVILTDSGTTALALTLAAGGQSTPVALPAYGCYDLATAADAAGVHVLLYDVTPATLQPEWPSLERALAAGAGTAVAVHFYGLPVDMRRFRSLAAASGAAIVEDSAQGIGGVFEGRSCGSLAPMSVLSFGRGKGLTGGGGGAVLVRDGASVPFTPVAWQRGTRDWVGSVAQWCLTRPSLYGLPSAVPGLRLGETIYHAPKPAGAMSAAAAGTVLGTWQASHEAVARRRQVADDLTRALRQSSGMAPVGPIAGTTAGYLRLPVLVAPLADRRERLAAARRLGIYPGYPLPLNSLPGFGRRVLNPKEPCDGARELAASLVTFPTHRYVRTGEIERLVARLGL